MSLHNTEELECPGCKKKIKTTIWQSINVVENPEMKNEVLEDRFNQFVCEKCGIVQYLSTGILYNDTNNRFQIYLVYDQDIEAFINEMNHSLKELYEQYVDVMKGYRLRVVTDRHELIEKIIVFEKGYNDFVLNINKVALKNALMEQGHKVTHIYFTAILDHEFECTFMVEDEKNAYSFKISKEFYDNIDKKQHLEPSGWCCINENNLLITNFVQ